MFAPSHVITFTFFRIDVNLVAGVFYGFFFRLFYFAEMNQTELLGKQTKLNRLLLVFDWALTKFIFSNFLFIFKKYYYLK